MQEHPGDDVIRLTVPTLVVLAGPSASGKSSWAVEWFRPDQVVSSDRLRALVGEGEHDQEASADAFELLDRAVQLRLARGLLTVVDSLGIDPAPRLGWLAKAREAGVPAVVVAFDTPAAVCRARNRARERRVPDRAMSSQLRRWAEQLPALAEEGWDALFTPAPVELLGPGFAGATEAAGRQAGQPRPLRFGLQLSRFDWEGGAAGVAERLGAIASAAEGAGFSSLFVMDHLLQIPQVGRVWEDLPEAYTTLAFLAASTDTVLLGPLVTPVTFRSPALLGKMVATLDMLSAGRALLGLGLGWWEREHRAYGMTLPPVGDRYVMLEDTVGLLRALWGPGGQPFEGRMVSLPETTCYPRPLQDRVPILVGGGGERRTLRLVARVADGCNLMGDPATVARKVAVLAGHCAAAGRPPDEVEVTHLSTTLVGRTRTEVDTMVERLRPRRGSAARFAAATHAGTVGDHVGRFRQFAEAGVTTAIVSLPDVAEQGAVERFGEVIDRFSGI